MRSGLPGYSPDVPHVLIDGVAIEARRLMLAPADVARVLRVEEADVRNMVVGVSCAMSPRTAEDASIQKR
jgi:hypothetical protein